VHEVERSRQFFGKDALIKEAGKLVN